MLLCPHMSLACLLDCIVDIVLIVVLLVWLSWYVDQGGLWLYGQKHWFGHGGHVKLRIEVRKRMAIGVDDKVVFDGRHVSDKVVGGVDGMLRLEAVVTELADVSWQGRSKICRQRRLLCNLEADMGLYDENNDMPYLVHMWWEVMFV